MVHQAGILLWNLSSAADAAAVNPSGINTLLPDGFNPLLVNSKPVFNSSTKVYQEIPVIQLF